ncbi:hypothetical protein AB1N83_013978 [Pleurotus pulmonarius]
MPAHPSTPPDFVTSSISNISAPPAKFSFKVANADGIVSDFLIWHHCMHSQYTIGAIDHPNNSEEEGAQELRIPQLRVHPPFSCLASQQAPVRIVLHLGSGASACAIKEGKSLDTSMGLTPLNGLPGATRAGAIDPSLIFHYTNKAGKITHDRKSAVQLHVTEV